MLPLGGRRDEDAERLLAAALATAHDAEDVVRAFAPRGVYRTTRQRPAAAHEDHIEAALRTLVVGGQRGVHLGGGRPERHWATVWPVEGLLIERDEPGRPGGAATSGARR